MTRPHRNAVAFALGGASGFIGFVAASGFFPEAAIPAFVGGGVVVFVLCSARALRLCGLDDDIAFDPAMRRGRYVPPHPQMASRGRRVIDFAAAARLAPRGAGKNP
jgi:hypothetical protein